jgi:hypothetical protein
MKKFKAAEGGMSVYEAREVARLKNEAADRKKQAESISKSDRFRLANERLNEGTASEDEKNYLTESVKNIKGAVSDKEIQSMTDKLMPKKSKGGEIVIGKGKDYIKDLL